MLVRKRRLDLVLTAVAVLHSSISFSDAHPGVTQSQDVAGQKRLGEVRSQIFLSFPRDAPGPSRLAGQAEAFVGREDLYLVGKQATRPLCVIRKGEPLHVIEQAAQHTNIVVINEDHSSPRDRAFVSSVLRTLRKQGYSVYAAETFTRFDSLDHEDVLGSDGWYSNEPTFGRTVRLAKELGYSLVPYEETQEQRKAGPPGSASSDEVTNRREQSQAENLVAAIFDKNPDTKVIVHVGHGHVRESPDRNTPGVIPMAQRLKTATGRDPLTISQTGCRSPTDGYIAAESYRLAAGNDVQDRTVDLYVGQPALKFKQGRPTWRMTEGQVPVAVPAQFLNLSERVIVEARPLDSVLGAVPADMLMIWPGERLPLLLPRGRYRIDGFVEQGRVDLPPSIVTVK